MPEKQDSIIIIGAGVLGLSTAIGLLESGYENVTILDRQDFEASDYSPFRGADSASADTLKVIRSAYGGASLHHELASEAISAWKSWNEEAGCDLFVNCGWTRMSSTGSLAAADVATLNHMAATGQGASQYRLGDAKERLRAQKDGWPTTKVDPFGRLGRSHGPAFDGVFDTLAGFVHASHACVFALRKVKQLGATVVLGQLSGCVDKILYAEMAGFDGDIAAGVATGVRTADGIEHSADVIIVAAGARSHMLVPELTPFVTASGANIIHVSVPPALQPKFRSDVFPVFSWGYTGLDEDNGLSGFPLDENGTLKFLHRSPKWTNPSVPPVPTTASVTSCPTAWSLGAKTNVPKSVVDTVKTFIADNIPDLVGCEIIMAKLCWDSFTVDLDFVMDWVPRRGHLLVVAGGSGHGFKFLPTLGKYAVKVLEGRPDKFTELWRWTDPEEEKRTKFETFMLDPEHRLDQQQMATASDLEWGTEP